MTGKLTAGACLWALTVIVRAAGPSQEPPAAVATRSTITGVYTAAQADAGQEIFAATCIGGCHNIADHKGIAFKQRWEGHLVWDLFKTIHVEMPKDDPGSLSDEEAAQLVACLLKLNGLPAGKEALPTDEAALRKIKIELPPDGGHRPAAGRFMTR
jgi:mono/diheme cytochrome c family protein